MLDPDAPAPALRRGRSWRPVVLGVAGVAVLGGAGWSIWSSVGAEAIRAVAEHRRVATLPPPKPILPPAPPVAGPISEGDTANWSEVSIFRAGANRPKPVVVVRRAKQGPTRQSGLVKEIFPREIICQGLILAARDGFDVVVRDVAIGDPDESAPADATYRSSSQIRSEPDPATGVPAGGGSRWWKGPGATAS